MKRVLTCLTICFVLIVFLLVKWGPFNLTLIYQNKLQAPLFTGFLTVGSFLLSLKTFILLKLKDGIYDNEKYKVRHESARKQGSTQSLYEPLQNLSRFLLLCVISALSTSVLQMTLGFIENKWATSICLASASTAMILVFLVWNEIRANLDTWFNLMNQQAK